MQDRADTGARRSRRAVVIGDSVASVASAIRDTLRIVQFMLTAPAASRVALAGDFNGWDPREIADDADIPATVGGQSRSRSRPAVTATRTSLTTRSGSGTRSARRPSLTTSRRRGRS